MKNKVALKPLLATLAFGLSVHVTFAAGPIPPPSGPIQPTMKSLEEIEPRTIIDRLPYTISRPGHYYLTNNLTIAVANSHGIAISADDVTLDLNGYALIGRKPAVTGTFPSGVYVFASVKNLHIKNGTVRNWGQAGIKAEAATRSRYEKVRSCDNAADGFYLGSHSAVQDCLATGNGNIGIVAQRYSSVENCSVSDNTLAGINVSDGSTVANCTVNNCGYGFNSNAGISASNGSIVKDCSVTACGHTGLYAGNGSSVTRCNVRASVGAGIVVGEGSTVEKCVASGNSAGGIQVSKTCRAVDNLCSYNGVGIHAVAPGEDNRIDSNMLSHNTGNNLRVDGVNNLIVRNQLQGCPADGFPAIASDNKLGPWVRMDATAMTSATGWENFFDLCP